MRFVLKDTDNEGMYYAGDGRNKWDIESWKISTLDNATVFELVVKSGQCVVTPDLPIFSDEEFEAVALKVGLARE
jgi:hypothetical protein